jgi:hypothetical protein
MPLAFAQLQIRDENKRSVPPRAHRHGWVKNGDIGRSTRTAVSTCSTAPTSW